MSCPHSTRADATPTTCSLCAGFAPSIARKLETLPDGDVLLDDWTPIERPAAAAEHHRAVSRNGAAATHGRPLPPPNPRITRVRHAPQAAPPGTVTRREVCARFGIARKTLEGARRRGCVRAVQADHAFRGPHAEFFYRVDDIERWIKARKPRDGETPVAAAMRAARECAEAVAAECGQEAA